MVVIISGCESGNDSETESNSDEFPFHYVSDNFQFEGFDYPENWDVVAVSSDVEMAYREEDDLENHQLSDTPFRYRFILGKEADTNKVSEEEIEKFNEKQASEEETTRQHYYHTYHEHFASLHVSSNGFLKVVSEFEEADTWEVIEHEVLVLHQENEWLINAYINNAYYDLHVKNEAQVTDEESLRVLLEVVLP